jgi:hypothetical protein
MYFLKSVHVCHVQVDSWEDLTDDAGNTIHIGKLEYNTKHGKRPASFRANVFPRDVKLALCLVVNLFLEQTKNDIEVSKNHYSLMNLIKTSAINEGLHANFFGKVSLFLLQIKCIHLIYGFKYYMNSFDFCQFLFQGELIVIAAN